tara:strand:- start:4257 stop:5186 length:930 start_codon:yes stop_codon:yes gene_type:complete
MNLPITSRIKRSPLLQTSGSTDPEDDKKNKNKESTVNFSGSTDGEDKITQGANGTPPIPKRTHEEAYAKRLPEYKSLSLDEYIEVAKKDELYGTSGSPGTPATPNVVVKGKGVDYDGTAKIETQGDVFKPYEKRQQSRSIKKEGRDIRRSKVKAAKIAKKLGKAKEGSVRKARLEAKRDENKREGDSFQYAQDRGDVARASGRRPGTKDVRTGERDMTMSELAVNAPSAKAQDALLKKNAVEADRRKKAKDNEITISSNEENGKYSQAANAVNPNSNKKDTAFPMRKSGVGKMKATPYKMKGSMFNKNY